MRVCFESDWFGSLRVCKKSDWFGQVWDLSVCFWPGFLVKSGLVVWSMVAVLHLRALRTRQTRRWAMVRPKGKPPLALAMARRVVLKVARVRATGLGAGWLGSGFGPGRLRRGAMPTSVAMWLKPSRR